MLGIFNRHRQIERFSAGFIALVSMLGALTLAAALFSISRSSSTLTSQAVYTKTFSFSRSGVRGEVVDAYRSRDGRRSLLLLRVRDVASISTDAANYQVFITGSDGSGSKRILLGEPAGAFYAFGNSGYMGVYLIQDSGFKPQVVSLTIRANAELTRGDASTSGVPTNDSSFKRYDQARIYYNPGGADAPHMDALDGDEPDMGSLYRQAVVAQQEDEVRQKLDDDLDKMAIDLTKITEYTDRLVSADGAVPPPVPVAIRGDEITRDSDGLARLKTSYTISRGYDLDWRPHRLSRGYSFLDRLIAASGDASKSPDAYMLDVASQRDDSGDFDTSKIEISMSDGTRLSDMGTVVPGSRGATVSADWDRLRDAWTTYYSDKKQYQTVDATSLLSLEAQARAVAKNISVRAGDDALKRY